MTLLALCLCITVAANCAAILFGCLALRELRRAERRGGQ